MVTSGDFRTYMRQLAGHVWNEQAAAHSYGLSLQEETLTEFLLLEMARTLSPLGLRVDMFNKRREGGVKKDGVIAEGADWEWYIDYGSNCGAMFRVQAKKLYRSPNAIGQYGGFKPNDKQIDDLIHRAVGGNPIYVFYNHPDVLDHALFGSTRQPDFFGRSCWGCSVTTAKFMKHAPDNKLATIKKGSVPWHRFFGIGGPCRPAAAMKAISATFIREGDTLPQDFITSHTPPDWAGLIRERRDLTEYLTTRHLQGVAFIDASDLRG
jgi:hypothetical protein